MSSGFSFFLLAEQANNLQYFLVAARSLRITELDHYQQKHLSAHFFSCYYYRLNSSHDPREKGSGVGWSIPEAGRGGRSDQIRSARVVAGESAEKTCTSMTDLHAHYNSTRTLLKQAANFCFLDTTLTCIVLPCLYNFLVSMGGRRMDVWMDTTEGWESLKSRSRRCGELIRTSPLLACLISLLCMQMLQEI